MLKVLLATCITTVSLMAGTAINYVKMKPLSQVINETPSSIKNDSKMPIITWGADTATISANGMSKKSTSSSLLKKAGVNLTLTKNDDFVKQVRQYLRGETPYLRGTVSMINMASDMIKNDKFKPVVVSQLSWSNGGDALVVDSSIKSLKDLKGKTIVVQAYGPHIDLLVATLKTAGLRPSDVKIVYVKDLTDTQNSDPATALREDKNINAAFVITPDALTLTSNGNVGTGAEGSLKGAKILFTTKSANKVIADVIAVRNDYYKLNKEQVERTVNAILKGQEIASKNIKNQSKASTYASIILDSPDSIEDMQGLFGDMKFTNAHDNQTFLEGNSLRNLDHLASQSAKALKELGVMNSSTSSIITAKHDWSVVNSDLSTKVESNSFNSNMVSQAVSKKQKTGTLDDDTIISFEIYFKPNQKAFTSALYEKEFNRVIEIASTFGGAVITVEGHSDNLNYLKQKKKGASGQYLKQLRQSAKNLSIARANAVKESVLNFAKEKGAMLDSNQFALIGWGIEKPTFNPPRNKQQWHQNMKVEFKIIQVEAEATEFEAL